MMNSRRDAEAQRERDRKEERDRRTHPTPSRAAAPTASRMNEYFVPRDGIDREVITADICRYLGNDALVRPGVYENPTTGQAQPGYFIKAYRNLTGAMIEDLKLDSARWEAERRAVPAGRPINAPSYVESRTHESRQYYGHNEGPSQQSGSVNSGPPQDRYLHEPQYASSQPPQSSYIQPSSSYDPRLTQSGAGGFPIHNEQPRGDYYVSAGTHFDSRVQNSRVAVTQGDSIPRGEVYIDRGPGPSYPPPDGRYPQYSQQAPVSSASPYGTSDPYYRGPPQDYHQDTQMGGLYPDSGRPAYNDQPSYANPGTGSSAPPNPSVSASANSSSRREHRGDDRRRDDRNDRHHRPR